MFWNKNKHIVCTLLTVRNEVTLLFWYQITSEGGTGLNLETHVKLMVDPQSTCMSAPPKISVCGSAKQFRV